MSSNSNELRENEKTPREQIADILNIQNMADSREIKQLEKLLADRENRARLDELRRIMKGEKTVTQFVGDVDDIVTYVFSAVEIQDRIKALSPTKSDGGDDERS